MKPRLCVSILLAFCSSAHAADKRAITHEDLWLMPRVGAPLASPDGRFAVFSVTEPSYKKDETVAHLWIVPSDGSAPARRLTASKTAETGVAWSADAKRLAFSAKRGDDKVPQIWILDIAQGGEAIKATTLSTGATGPQFSPDGKRILFVSEVFPDAKTDADNQRVAKEREERKYKARVYTGFPVRNFDHWIDEKQPHVFVQTIGVNDARDLLAGSALAKLPGFSEPEDKSGAVWAPDGRSIVFVASRNRDRAAWQFTNADLFAVPVDGGEPRRLTNADSLEAGDNYGKPRFSEDGKVLYALLAPHDGHIYNATRLAVLDWPGAKAHARIEPPNKTVRFELRAGRRTVAAVYSPAEDSDEEELYRASREGGEAKLVATPAHGVFANLSGATHASVLLAQYDSATEPPEIVRLDANGKAPRASLVFTVDVAGEQARSRSGRDISRSPMRAASASTVMLLRRPPHFDAAKKYPLLVVMHGGPFSQWRDSWGLRWNYHLLAAPGYSNT